MSTKRIKFKNDTLYLTNDFKVCNKLVENHDYIIIYDEAIHQQGDLILLAPVYYSESEYYNIIKKISKYYYAVNNMLEIGFSNLGNLK